MTVEAFRATNVTASPRHDQDNLFDFATFISGSLSWKIIDSWTGTTYNAAPTENTILGRYKGDPIESANGGPPWTTRADVLDGGGIVIQQKNPRSGFPEMQVCIQAADVAAFGCISGHSYRHDEENNPPGIWTSIRGTIYRVGTQGDWVDDDVRPDFANVTKASDTYYQGWHNHGGSSTYRHYFVIDDDWIVWIESNETTKDFFNVMWMGQYNTKSLNQESVVNPAYGILSNMTGDMLYPDAPTTANNFFLKETSFQYEVFGCLDENGVWRDWEYICTPGLYEFFKLGSTQSNEFNPTVGIDLYEIVVKGRVGTTPGHDDRLIGSLRGVYVGMRLGNGAKFDGGDYLCLGNGYGVIVEWDGTTNV